MSGSLTSDEGSAFEEINGVSMVPGTVHLLDCEFGKQFLGLLMLIIIPVERRMSVKHSDGASDLVLVPQPTNHPDDPLNWDRVRKEYHFWLLWIWGFIAAVSVNWV